MRILFLGAGATGGYFGGRLMEAGADVTFLVRPRRQAQLRENGLVVESPAGNIRLPAQTITKARPGYDLVVLTSKAYDLDGAIEAIRPALEPRTLVMPLLNGLNHIDLLDAAFGRERVLGGMCHIPITLEPDGTIRHLSPVHRLAFGARSPGQDAMVGRLAEAFRPTPVEWRRSDAIMQDLWEKFVFLATLAAATCLMRAPVRAIVSQPGGEGFLRALFAEAQATALAEGYPPSPASVTDSLDQLTDKESALTASMMRDVVRGHRVEGEHIIGDMVRRGERHGLSMPLMSLALLHLRAYESERLRRAG
ncbi:2-dehydropantoate 2-reductase [Rhodospirillum centenum]|uniref:2-dehydropantoate 2-reductase n=1 Tax=Rhodospirillum centenum (strain ATCC 51521 / SW) TaxID=414684 RepID=B6IWY6_RHOCS|nr:2-dehydropantoate 2-reductase [Rhodospirillum centenum]ACJ00810.1 2-dehydropantoate 2-reductase [Rhodospirillum centenum SW]